MASQAFLTETSRCLARRCPVPNPVILLDTIYCNNNLRTRIECFLHFLEAQSTLRS